MKLQTYYNRDWNLRYRLTQYLWAIARLNFRFEQATLIKMALDRQNPFNFYLVSEVL